MEWQQQISRWKVVRVFGIGALIAGAATVALWLLLVVLLIAPLIFWLAWNQLGFGPALGLPELGFWAIVLATLFLVVGWFGKVVITGIVFLVDPGWLHAQALVHWPEPTVCNFLAVVLLAALAASPHARDHHADRDRKRRRAPAGAA